MSKTLYVDAENLEKYIEKSGLKIGFLVDKLGISRQAFDRKRKGELPFRASEVFVLCHLLDINDEDRDKIFCPKVEE